MTDSLDAFCTGGLTIGNVGFGVWKQAPRLSDVTGAAVLMGNPGADFCLTLGASEAQAIGLPAVVTRLRVAAGANWVPASMVNHPVLVAAGLTRDAGHALRGEAGVAVDAHVISGG
jgi:hypothetical protein